MPKRINFAYRTSKKRTKTVTIDEDIQARLALGDEGLQSANAHPFERLFLQRCQYYDAVTLGKNSKLSKRRMVWRVFKSFCNEDDHDMKNDHDMKVFCKRLQAVVQVGGITEECLKQIKEVLKLGKGGRRTFESCAQAIDDMLMLSLNDVEMHDWRSRLENIDEEIHRLGDIELQNASLIAFLMERYVEPMLQELVEFNEMDLQPSDASGALPDQEGGVCIETSPVFDKTAPGGLTSETSPVPQKSGLEGFTLTRETLERWMFTASALLVYIVPVRNSTIELMSRRSKLCREEPTHNDSMVLFGMKDSKRTSKMIRSRKEKKHYKKDTMRVEINRAVPIWGYVIMEAYRRFAQMAHGVFSWSDRDLTRSHPPESREAGEKDDDLWERLFPIKDISAWSRTYLFKRHRDDPTDSYQMFRQIKSIPTSTQMRSFYATITQRALTTRNSSVQEHTDRVKKQFYIMNYRLDAEKEMECYLANLEEIMIKHNLVNSACEKLLFGKRFEPTSTTLSSLPPPCQVV